MHESYKKWLNDGQPKIFCACGCGGEIIIKKHKWCGIPKYLLGHHTKGIPKSEEHKRKLSQIKMGIKRPEAVVIQMRKTKTGQNCGDNNPNWRGGTSFQPYCYRFNNKLKEEIRIRDNKICQNCDKTEKENNRKLSVHHIHYDKENCYPDLITLCHICNMKANGSRNYWEEHFMEKLRKRNLLNYFGNNYDN